MSYEPKVIMKERIIILLKPILNAITIEMLEIMKDEMINDCTFVGEKPIVYLPCRSAEMI